MIVLKNVLCSAAALALIAGLASPAAADEGAPSDQIVVTGHAAIGDFGVDLSARDESTKPGADNERYASGKWIDATTIPADRPSIGSFANLAEDVRTQMQQLITSAPKTSKAGALYGSFMDEKALERVGLKPLMRDIAQVRAISDKSQMARYMGTTDGAFGSSLIANYIDVDPDNPTTNVLYLSQAGLGLPEKDYYLKPSFAPQRKAYVDYMTRTFRAIGPPHPRGAAAKVIAFET